MIEIKKIYNRNILNLLKSDTFTSLNIMTLMPYESEKNITFIENNLNISIYVITWYIVKIKTHHCCEYQVVLALNSFFCPLHQTFNSEMRQMNGVIASKS